MTKTEFIGKLAGQCNLSKNDAERIVNAFLDAVEDALSLDGRIALPGFGSFSARPMAERKAVNPRTGEPVLVAARNTVRFRPSQALTELVN